MSEMETDEQEVFEIQQNKQSEPCILNLTNYMCLFGSEGWKHVNWLKSCRFSDGWLLSLADFSRISTRGANPADVAASPAHSAHVTW